MALDQGDFEHGQTVFEEALGIFRELESKLGQRTMLLGLGNVSAFLGDYERAEEYHQESYDLARQINDEGRTTDALMGLGQVARLQGAYARANNLLRRCLAYYFEAGLGGDLVLALEQLASLARAQGNFRRAARLFGRSEAMRQQLSYARFPYQQPEYEREAAEIQQALGEEAFAEEWDKGAAMELEEAVTYASS